MTPRRTAPPLAFVLAIAACDGSSVLAPHGPAAERIATMAWFLFGMAAVVTALVLALLAMIVRRAHRSRRGAADSLPPVRARDLSLDPSLSETPSAERRALRWVLLGGVVLPTVVVTPLFFYAVALHGRLLPPDDAGLVVEVEARQWFWVVRYLNEQPQLQVTSANELHIPVGVPVRLHLSSTDVIHSFWVPALQGKTDLIPGTRTVTWIQAERAGVYRGQCAEFCGLQHTRMGFEVIAHEPAEFDAWLARERLPAAPATSPAAATPSEGAMPPASASDTAVAPSGFEVFQQRGCGVCHTIRGTPARGTIGPDLTHVGSRRTLAAGTLPNNPGNLSGWIANPQVLKPGNHMPRVPLTPEELHAVTGYLQALR